MRQKLNFLEGACPVTSGVKTNTAVHKKNIISTVKHGGGSVMAWALGPGRLPITDGNMNSALYQNPEGECQFVTAGQWSQTHPNTPASPPLNGSSQSPDLNPIEMLWHDLKQSIHALKPSNVSELKQFCKEEWAKIPPEWCERLNKQTQKYAANITQTSTEILTSQTNKEARNILWMLTKDKYRNMLQ